MKEMTKSALMMEIGRCLDAKEDFKEEVILKKKEPKDRITVKVSIEIDGVTRFVDKNGISWVRE